VLDGFLLLHSCCVKLPHEAIRSKLAGENIIDVREEDLVYFKNLSYIDLSDNHLNLGWLQNFEGLQELDMQYNQMSTI
jgi:Leucine-rich repeat (LRR) protein